MDQQNAILTWNGYSDHLRSMMKELLTNDSLSDVTLVTEDKKMIKAHKNILSACSPFLKDVFQEDKNLNTIIYLQDTQSFEAELIIQFIYFGEVIVWGDPICSMSQNSIDNKLL